ncbi:MAG: SPOR domain-containing protein [Pseudohongiellaceae bacterium]
MNQGTKQRVVGSIVLVAIAMIFLPVFLDGEGSYTPTLSSRIPEPPVIPLMPDPVQERSVFTPEPAASRTMQEIPVATDQTDNSIGDAIATGEPGTGTNSPADNVTVPTNDVPEITDEPQLDAAGLPVGWSVRLGSFSSATNAANLLQRLTDSGYKAYTRELTGNQDTLTAVYVGPRIDRTAIEELKSRLLEEFQLNGMVVRFEVDQF